MKTIERPVALKVYNKILGRVSTADATFCDYGNYLHYLAVVQTRGQYEDKFYIISAK